MLHERVIKAGARSKIVMYVILTEIALIFLFMPRSLAEYTINKEREILYNHLGGESAHIIEKEGVHWYDAYIVRSGVESAVYHYFLPTMEQRRTSTGLENLGQKFVFPFFKSRVEVFFAILEQMFVRLSVLFNWLPLLVILMAPAIIDGYFTRAKRKYSYAYASPLMRNASMVGINLLIYGPLMIYFVPIPITPHLYGILIFLAAAFVGIAIANTQKVI